MNPSPWEGDTVREVTIPLYSFLLDPSFWQSLGKELRWFECPNPKECALGGNCTGDGWRDHWKEYIDHLAEGNDTESFFAHLDK